MKLLLILLLAAASALGQVADADVLTITTTSLPDGMVGEPYSAAVTAQGGVPPLKWSIAQGKLPGGLSLADSTGAITGRPKSAGSFAFTVRVRDHENTSVTQPFVITILAALVITTSSLPNGTAGAPYSAELSASGGSPPYTWSATGLPAGLAVNGSTITGTPAAPGSYTVSLQVRDSAERTRMKSLGLTIAAPLEITTASLPAGSAGVAYSATLAAAGGTPPYTWSATGLPQGLTLSGNKISGAPAEPGAYSVVITVRDTGARTASTTLVIAVAPAVAPLGILATALPSGTTGEAYSATLTATGGVPPYTWSVASGALPAGLTLDSTGQLSGKPAQSGAFDFRARVRDSAGTTAERDFKISVAAALVLTGRALPDASVGANYSYTLQASGGAEPYTWTISSGSLPAGLALDSHSGVISGKPATPGLRTFSVSVSDAAGQDAAATFTLNVASTLAITSTSPLPGAAAGTDYSYSFAALGGAQPYSWSITDGQAPAGLVLNRTTGVLSGTPAQAGTYSFTIKVTDSANSTASGNFTLSVVAALSVATTDLPGGSAGTAYSATLQAIAGTSPYTWSIAEGSLPPGLALAESGEISGTPSSSGEYRFTVQVRDSAGATASRPLAIVISQQLRISTAAELPQASVGVAWSQRLEATGGTPPYSWAIAAGSLPAGISLNGAELAGTPSAAGTFEFTARVTDSNGATATQAFSLLVAAEGLPQLSLAAMPDTASSLEQPAVSLTIDRAFPVALAGRLTLAFEPDADEAADDPAIQFSTGGRSAEFTIPANSTQVDVPAGLAVQTGSVAGTITLSAQAGADGGFSISSTRAIRIARSAPAIIAVKLVSTASGFEVWITGLSNTRELESATFEFLRGAGALRTAQARVDYSGMARQWFQGQASKLFGSQFTIVQPFTISGDRGAVGGVRVTLSNSTGPSQAVSAQF